jgi:hypothetical protein
VKVEDKLCNEYSLIYKVRTPWEIEKDTTYLLSQERTSYNSNCNKQHLSIGLLEIQRGRRKDFGLILYW